jgi:hypothetical protein
MTSDRSRREGVVAAVRAVTKRDSARVEAAIAIDRRTKPLTLAKTLWRYTKDSGMADVMRY